MTLKSLSRRDEPLLRRAPSDDRAPRRHGREVHRRRGDGVCSGSRACGRTTRCARCGPRPRSASACPRSRSEVGVELAVSHRHEHGPGARRRRRESGDRRCGQRRGAPGAGRAARERSCSAKRRMRLVRDAVEVEPLEPLRLKGKSAAGACFPAAGCRSARAGSRSPLRRSAGRRARESCACCARRGIGRSRSRAVTCSRCWGGRRGEIAAGRGAALGVRRRRARAERSLPSLWRGDHVLAAASRR